MSARRKKRPRLIGALILLILLGLLLPLGSLLTGFLPGGKSRAESVPEPGPDEKGTLEVTVVRAKDLAPIAGARVLFERLSGGEAEAESDARGRVRLQGLGAGPVRVQTTVDGRKAQAWADPALQRDVRLSVGPEPRRSGHVAPARARVALLAEDGSELASTETDAQGRYDLPDLEGSVCAVAEGFAPAVAPRGDLVLRDGTLVAGKLIGGGAGGLSVYGAVAAPGSDGMLPFRAEWRVEADGSFRGRLPPGAEAFGIYRGLPVRIAPGAIELPASARASGVVRRADGSPAARAVLFFRPLVDADFATPLPGLRVEANARGEFAATGFAAVRYSVEVYAPGCATRVVPEVAPAGGPVEIALDPGFAIGGFVVDTAGLPVPNAHVRAVGTPEGEDRPVLSAVADEQGRFHIAGLGGAQARVRVTADGYHPTTLERLDPSSDVRVVLQADR